MRDFDKLFERHTFKSYIATTHRFGEPTVNESCEFVLKNPSQFRKHVISSKKEKTHIHVIMNCPGVNHDGESLIKIIAQLMKQYSYEKLCKMELQIISRYNHDIDRLLNTSSLFLQHNTITWRNPQKPSQELIFDFCSIHKSKGITRDIVIVLNMNAGSFGMPATRESDDLINMLLAHQDNYPYAEERRLFYVAITRARIATFLIANIKSPSPFILELDDALAGLYPKKKR